MLEVFWVIPLKILGPLARSRQLKKLLFQRCNELIEIAEELALRGTSLIALTRKPTSFIETCLNLGEMWVSVAIGFSLGRNCKLTNTCFGIQMYFFPETTPSHPWLNQIFVWYHSIIENTFESSFHVWEETTRHLLGRSILMTKVRKEEHIPPGLNYWPNFFR